MSKSIAAKLYCQNTAAEVDDLIKRANNQSSIAMQTALLPQIV